MQAGLFEIRLFNDDLRTILQAQGDILRHNLAYLRLSLVPMLLMLVPLLLTIVQLESFYGYRAVQPGETFLLKVKLQMEGLPGSERPDARLHLPPGLRAETDDAWMPMLGELAWRLHAERPGLYSVGVQLGDDRFAKEVRVTSGFGRLSPARPRPGFTAQLLHPAEPPLPGASRLERIDVSYAARQFAVLGWQLPWLLVFFVLVLVFALLLRGSFRVAF
jgi:hypothetical protein